MVGAHPDRGVPGCLATALPTQHVQQKPNSDFALRHWHPIHKNISLLWIPSISATKTVTLKLTKKAAAKLSDHTHSRLHIYGIPHWPYVICKMDSGVFSYKWYVTITNSQHHKKRMLIVIRFNASRYFFHRNLLLTA